MQEQLIEEAVNCLRCGISNSEKPYGNCYTGYASYKRHLWDKTTKPKEQDIDALLQDNERFEKDYTVFTFKLNGVPIKFVALADAEKAMKVNKQRKSL